MMDRMRRRQRALHVTRISCTGASWTMRSPFPLTPALSPSFLLDDRWQTHTFLIPKLRSGRLCANFLYGGIMIKRIKGGYRLYSRKKNAKTGKRRNLGTFKSRAAAEKHERAVQFFKRH